MGYNHIMMSYSYFPEPEDLMYIFRRIVCNEKDFREILFDDLMLPFQFMIGQDDMQWNENITKIVEDVFMKLYPNNKIL